MKHFYTVVLERMARFSQDFATEPYECGWASEAMFFLRAHELEGEKTSVDLRVQVSVDGIEWIDEGTTFPTVSTAGNSFVRVSHFGGWLRLVGVVAGNDPSLRLTIQLVLKE